jgi:hypothetical protein
VYYSMWKTMIKERERRRSFKHDNKKKWDKWDTLPSQNIRHQVDQV